LLIFHKEYLMRNIIKFYHKLSIFILLLPVIFQTGFLFSDEKADTCIKCHNELDGNLSEPAKRIKGDIHYDYGLSCVDCHGGDPKSENQEVAMGKEKGFKGSPEGIGIVNLCGGCHSNVEFIKKFNPGLRVDQLKEYFTSQHGKSLLKGKKKVATCVNCHGVHNIKKVTDPNSSVYPLNVADTCAKCHADALYMKEFKIPVNQFDDFKQSVHAFALLKKNDISSPTCNDCHGNHGAVPPGISSISNVCGQCHIRQAEFFEKSPHKVVFDASGISECIECHSNHRIEKPTDDMIGIGDSSVCSKCHTEGDRGYTTARDIRSMIDILNNKINSSKEILHKAERAGMEVSKSSFELVEAHNKLIQARVLIHSFSTEKIKKIVDEGNIIADKTYQQGLKALEDLNFRRKWLVISVFFILFLSVVIYIKIKQIEKGK